VVVKKEGFVPQTLSVKLRPGEVLPQMVELEPLPPPSRHTSRPEPPEPREPPPEPAQTRPPAAPPPAPAAGWEAVRALNAPAGPAPGLSHPPAAQGADPELAQGVPDALAAGAAAPAGKLGGLPGLAAVLHHQRQGLGEADLPPRVDVDRRAGAGPGAHEVHAAEQRLLFEERSWTDGAFHGGHTTPGG
jgi:hypothetical protein